METKNDSESPEEDEFNASMEKTVRENTAQDEVIKRRAVEYLLFKYSDEKLIPVDREKKADIDFLKSILVDMAVLTPKANRQFKINVLQLIDDVLMSEL